MIVSTVARGSSNMLAFTPQKPWLFFGCCFLRHNAKRSAHTQGAPFCIVAKETDVIQPEGARHRP